MGLLVSTILHGAKQQRGVVKRTPKKQLEPVHLLISFFYIWAKNFIYIYLILSGIPANRQLTESDCTRVRICERRLTLLIRECCEQVLSRPEEVNSQGLALEAAIEAAALAIIDLKDNLNEWDSKVGDGDCGSTMCRGATAIQQDLKKHYPLNDGAETINEIGSSIRRVMGGTSGILYDIFCKAAYARLKQKKQSDHITPLEWADAFEGAISAVMLYGGAAAGYRTMLDALIPASALLTESLSGGDDPLDAFVKSSDAAVAGAESTKQMEAVKSQRLEFCGIYIQEL